MFSIKKMYSTIENGHLNWNFFKTNIFVWLIWLFFFCFSFFHDKRYIPLIFALCILIISYINYKNYHSVGTKWCWLANSLMIYYAIYYYNYHSKKKIKFVNIYDPIYFPLFSEMLLIPLHFEFHFF